MSRFCISTEPIAARRWRSGHPFRPRTGRCRRVVMVVLLVLFTLVITGYAYVTDSDRLRDMAQTYLSRLIGGRVVVGAARLSIFDGLKVEGIKIYVDEGNEPDSLLFSAQAFVLKYDPSRIIKGEIEAAQIIAQKPHVHLTENVVTHQWNVYRLGKNGSWFTQPPPSAQPSRPIPLPEILLRNARVEISQLRDGQLHDAGYAALDGQLTPTRQAGKFTFELQTRGEKGIGPWATGTVSLGPVSVDAELHDFVFNRDVRSMLPEKIRELWERHEGAARIAVFRVHYRPEQVREKLQAEMELTDVNVTIPPEDWLSTAEITRRSSLNEGFTAMQRLYRVAGYIANSDCAAGTAANAESGQNATSIRRAFGAFEKGANPAVIQSGAGSFASHAVVPCPADVLAALTMPAPLELREASGTFVYSDTGVEVKNVTGRVEGNALRINGRMSGYKPDAPFTIQIESLPNEPLQIPATPRYLNALPPDVREIYTAIRPNGTCALKFNIRRLTPGSRLLMNGQVDLLDGVFNSVFFPYPLREAQGTVTFGYEPQANADFVHVHHVRGRGMADGPNRDTWIEVNGDVGPLAVEIPDPQVVLHVSGININSEPALLRAFPPEVRKPLEIFDAEHTGRFPMFHGDFVTTVLHRAGWAWKWTFDTDLKLDDASGKLVGFPYPVEHLAAEVHVRDGYVDIINAHMKRHGASMRVDGRVTWTDGPPSIPPKEPLVTTDIHVAVRNLPLDKELLAAMPPDQALWIQRIGLGGKLDVDGRVFQGLPDPTRPGMAINKDDVRFDLGIALHDGTLWPASGTFSVSDASGRVHLTRDALEIKEMRGRRNGADLSGDGAIAWSDDGVQLALHVKGKNLAVDGPLYSLLPRSAQESWDEVQPQGALDLDMTYRDVFGGVGSRGVGSGEVGSRGVGSRGVGSGDVASGGVGSGEVQHGLVQGQPISIVSNPASVLVISQLPTPSLPTPQRPTPPLPTPLLPTPHLPTPHLPTPHLPPAFATIPSGFHATLKPLGMRCTIKLLPYRLDDVRGTIVISPDKVIVDNVTATHGAAKIAASGTGMVAERSVWDLRLSGHDLAIDDELRHALPPVMVTMLDPIKFAGTVDFDFPKFVYRGDGIVSAPATRGAQPASASSTSASAAPPVDIDLASKITFKRCALEAGVPIKEMFGEMGMAVTVRAGKISAMLGNISLPRVIVAGRNLTNVNLEILKPADRSELQLNKIHGELARGQVAGSVRLLYPEVGPSTYFLSLVLRNADLETIVKDAEKDLKGELTASLQLEGSWDNAALRRGRGDVVVTGKELYHLPLVMGLFQVTNLSLPIATPFKNGGARYSVEGPRINFERIELKSDNMLMRGNGYLDFKSKQVRLTFTTDNPSGLKVPFLNDLLNNARGELLKISIKGTIKEPKVEANSFGTFTTSIDEVFKPDGRTAK